MTLWTLIADFFTLDPEITSQAVQQEAWIPIAIAAVSAAGSLYSKYKAGQDMKGQANKGNELSEKARQDAMARLSPDALYTAFQTFFPGLTSDPNPHTNTPESSPLSSGYGGAGSAPEQTGAPNQGAGYYAPNPQARENERYMDSLDGARAQGGPVEAGGSYLVGEQGPEVVTPTQDGNVTPNPATAQPGGPPPAGQGDDVGIGAPPGGMPGEEAPGTPGGPTTPSSQTGFDQEPMTANDLMMQNMFNYLSNPGQFSTADYERRQEDASAGYQSRVQDINAQAMAGGIDPGSGVAGSMMAGAARNEANIKSEAARDQQLIEQQLRRADIAAGSQMFMGMLNYILQLQGARANAAQGSFANPQVINTDMGTGLAQAGDQFSQAIESYNNNKSSSGSNNDAADQSGVYGPPIQGEG